MQLKVVYRPKETVLVPDTEVEIAQRVYYVDRLEDTYTSFFDTVYKDIIGDENQMKQRENFRLRAYNVQYKIMLDTYTGRENESLQSLKIYPMKTLAFEEKAPSEIFEEYDLNSMLIKVNFWRNGLEALNEEALKPVEIKVRKDMPMGELQVRLAEENKKATQQVWVPSDIKVLKRNPLLNTSHLEVLSEHPEKLLNQLRINEGVNLFVENKNVPHPTGLHIGENEKEGLINTTGTIDTPKWEIEHELDGLRF